MALGSRSWGHLRAAVGVSAVMVVATLVLTSVAAQASAVSIHDDSHVLDVTRVQNDAATLPDPVAIYTTTQDAGDKAAFDREAQAKVTAPTLVVIAVNTQSHHLAIRTGPQSRVTQPPATEATQAFINTFHGNSDYTAATIAALGSLRTAIPAGGPARNGPQRRPTAYASSGVPVGGLLCLLVVIGAGAVFLLRRRRRRGPSVIDYEQGPPGYGRTGYYPGPPGYGPPGYYQGGPGYGGSGAAPWVAGGVGAAAGGLLGYELGRNEGREEEREREERYDDDGGGFGGGGADGDFGDGSSNGGGGDF